MSKAKVNSEVRFGLFPVLQNERMYSFMDMFLVTGGYAVATWCYLQGGWLGAMLGMKGLIANTFFGIGISVLLMSILSLYYNKYGVEHYLGLRPQFGYWGAAFLFLLGWGVSLGWFALNSQMFGYTVSQLYKVVGWEYTPLTNGIWIAICVFIPWVIAVIGPVAIKWFNRIMVPCLYGIGFLLLYLVFANFSPAQLSSLTPVWLSGYPDARYPFSIAMEWNIAFGFSWFCSVGGVARLAKSAKGSYWGMWGGFGFVMAFFIILGGFTSLIMSSITGDASTDPTEWLIPLGGLTLGVLSLFFIGVANFTTNATGFYLAALSTKILAPKRRFSILAIWVLAWTMFLALWGALWASYYIFIAVVGCTLAPAIGIMIADIFILHRKLSVKALFDSSKNGLYRFTKGFNLISFLVMGIGTAVYFALYNPLLAYPNSEIFLYTTSSIPSFIVSFLVYIAIAQIKPVRRYLGLSDAKKITTEIKAK